jgi:hypothetical protein
MKKVIFLSIIPFLFFCFLATAQRITYSEPDRDDPHSFTYDIIGKINGNVLIYKNYRELHYLSVYDADMKLLSKDRLTYLPDRISNIDFINYSDYFLLIYQFQKRNTVYCMGAKVDGKGKLINDPVLLDTTEIGSNSVGKIYSVIHSDDKQKIMIFKINTKSDKENVVTTVLIDQMLNPLHKSRNFISMPERNDFLTEFQVDNDGDLACIKAWGTAQNDNISKITLLTKSALSDEVKSTDLRLNGVYLDDIRLKVDNYNKHYLITSFFSKQRRNNVDGLYFFLWDKASSKEVYTNLSTFSDELRAEARGENSVKMAFNDFFLRQIIMKKDGGFFISAEANYTTTRGNNTYSRWDYMYGNAYMYPGYYNYGSPYYYPGSRFNNYNQTRYYSDNIAVLSFDEKGKMEWSNVLHKSQFDDNTDNYLGYGLINTGDQAHFLFNVQEKRQTVFSDQTISPDGQISHNGTLKNLDRGYDFMPRHAKQVGARQIIVPCMYRNYICFAKVEL